MVYREVDVLPQFGGMAVFAQVMGALPDQFSDRSRHLGGHSQLFVPWRTGAASKLRTKRFK